MQHEADQKSVKKDIKQPKYEHQIFPHIPQLHNDPAQPIPNSFNPLIDPLQ